MENRTDFEDKMEPDYNQILKRSRVESFDLKQWAVINTPEGLFLQF